MLQAGLAGKTIGGAADMLSTPFTNTAAPVTIQQSSGDPAVAAATTNSNNMQPLINPTGQITPAQQQFQDATYTQNTKYLDPQFQQQQSDLDSKLAAQGITPGSDAYNREMLNFNNTKESAYSTARSNAITTGDNYNLQSGTNTIAASNSALNGGLNANAQVITANTANNNANLANNNQQFSQSLQTYNNPLNVIASLNNGTQVGNPVGTFGTTTPTDLTGVYNNQYNNQVSQQNSNNNLFGSILGSAAKIGAAAVPYIMA